MTGAAEPARGPGDTPDPGGGPGSGARPGAAEPAPTVLVVNSGSSSFKYQLIDMQSERPVASGLIERIGEATGRLEHSGTRGTLDREEQIANHRAGFKVMLDAFAADGPDLTRHPPVAIGHRVVHGGDQFFEPTIVTPAVEKSIQALAELAPLHNPANLAGIEAARTAFPGVPEVAVFDTAFHQTLAPAAYTYAIDSTLAKRYRVRRYGFHGTSHKYVSGVAAHFLGRPKEELNQIVFHLGNGASACAIRAGRSVEISMGLTPLEGLVMGTRSGDLDPAVLVYLHRQGNLSVDDLDDLLNRRSGLLGLSGRGDMRDVTDAAAAGDGAASGALDVYLHRIRQYVGGYYAQLGHLDAIVFTAGVGENSAVVRAGALDGLEELGIVVDPGLNESSSHEPRRISAANSKVDILVIPTNEELEIARQTMAVVGASGTAGHGRTDSAVSPAN